MTNSRRADDCTTRAPVEDEKDQERSHLERHWSNVSADDAPWALQSRS